MDIIAILREFGADPTQHTLTTPEVLMATEIGYLHSRLHDAIHAPDTKWIEKIKEINANWEFKYNTLLDVNRQLNKELTQCKENGR